MDISDLALLLYAALCHANYISSDEPNMGRKHSLAYLELLYDFYYRVCAYWNR